MQEGQVVWDNRVLDFSRYGGGSLLNFVSL